MSDSIQLFRYYDPEKTYSKNSVGEKLETFITLSGQKYPHSVPYSLWGLGYYAYQKLAEEAGFEVDLENIIEEAPPIINGMCTSLEVITSKELKLLRDADDHSRPVTMDEVNKGSMLAAIGLHVDAMSLLLTSGVIEKSCLCNGSYYLLVLLLLDNSIPVLNAIRADRSKTEGLLQLFSCTSRVFAFVDSLKSIEAVIKKRAKKASAASKKETEEMRKEALDYYYEHKGDFTSRIAAARFIGNGIVPVTERTVDNWISNDIKSKNN